jgi:hypothetical protein
MRVSVLGPTTLASLVFTASVAGAQPTHETAPRELNPHVALGLSLGITAAGFAAIGVGRDEHVALTGTGVALVGLGPTAGHWYQGRLVTPGLVMRSAGMVVLGIGLSQVEDACEANCRNNKAFSAMMVAGLFAFAIGTVHDIATAPIEARRTNARNRQRRIENLTLAPQVSNDQAGLVLGGSF